MYGKTDAELKEEFLRDQWIRLTRMLDRIDRVDAFRDTGTQDLPYQIMLRCHHIDLGTRAFAILLPDGTWKLV